MFSKILVKLIDQAIVPAVVLLSVRLIAVLLLSQQLQIPFNLNSAGFSFASHEQYLVVNSYSTLAMIGVLAIGLLYILLKAVVFHESHIAPHLTAKVFSLRLSSLIQNSFDLYSQGSIWLSYLFLVTLSSIALAFFGLIYVWVAIVGLVLSIFCTVVLVLDIENELDLNKKTPETQEEIVLRFGGDNE